MTDANSCPATDQLQGLFIGELSEEASVTISEHLTQCAACQATTKTLVVSDTLLSLVRQAGRQPVVATPVEVQRVIARLRDRTSALALSIALTETLLSAADDSAEGVKSRSKSIDEELTELLTTVQPAHAPEELGRLGDFRLLKVLGYGGMGAVFLAEDVRLRRLVAMKLVRPDVAGRRDSKERFLREARAAANINHENVVTIYQVGEENGVPFLAQELLDGETLETKQARQGRFTVVETLNIGKQIAAGLAAAHSRGLVHRDIKPANVFLAKNPHASSAAETVKLLDFGLARVVSDSTQLTQSGLILGTPAFMSPEQASGEVVDHRTDLFSLGCVLYLMLTGERPFPGENLMSVLAALASHIPTTVAQLQPQVPSEVSQLVDQLLAKSANDRPSTANQVVARLTSCLSLPLKRQTSPHPIEPGTATKPRTNRPVNKQLTLFGGVLAFFLLGLIIITITKKDGTKSKFEVPDTSTIEITNSRENSSLDSHAPNKSSNEFVVNSHVDETKASLGSSVSRPNLAVPSPTDRSLPYVILRDGQPVGEYADFPVPLPEFRDGDVLEIRGNGPFRLPQITTSRGLLLRAADGYHPVFVPDDSVPPEQHWIAVLEGPLRVEGCEFRRMKENDWDIFGAFGDSCEIVNCTLARGASNSSSLVECRCPTVRIAESLLIAGSGHVGFKLRSEVRGLSVENTVYLCSSYCTFSIDQSDISRTFRLEHNTFSTPYLFGGDLFKKISDQPVGEALQVIVRHNVFANEVMLVAQDFNDLLTVDDYRSRLVWQGEGNIAIKFANQSFMDKLAAPGNAGLVEVPQLQFQVSRAWAPNSALADFNPEQWRLLSSDGATTPAAGVDFSRFRRPRIVR